MQRLQTALYNLDRDGWTFMKLFAHSDERRYLSGPDDAYKFLTNPGRGKAPFCGDRIELDKKDGSRVFIRIRDVDEVAAFDYFESSGDPTTVANPELAKKLQDLDTTGLQIEPAEHGDARGAWGGYCALMRGDEAKIRIGGADIGTFKASTPADVDKALDSHAQVIDVYQKILLPAADHGILQAGMVGTVLQALNVTPAHGTLADRADRFLQLAKAVHEGPDGEKPGYEQTQAAIEAYQHDTPDAEWIIRGIGGASVQSARQALQRADRDRKPILERAIRAGFPVPDAQRATTRILQSPNPERATVTMERIAAAGRLQRGYHDYPADAERAIAGDPAHADACATVLSALAQRGLAENARDTMRKLNDSPRPLEEAAATFANAFVLGGDLDAALDAALRPAAEATPIERTAREVRIAGVSVPIRE